MSLKNKHNNRMRAFVYRDPSSPIGSMLWVYAVPGQLPIRCYTWDDAYRQGFRQISYMREMMKIFWALELSMME